MFTQDNRRTTAYEYGPTSNHWYNVYEPQNPVDFLDTLYEYFGLSQRLPHFVGYLVKILYSFSFSSFTNNSEKEQDTLFKSYSLVMIVCVSLSYNTVS